MRKVAPSLRHAFDAARDRVADVVQLEIEEDLLAGARRARATSGKPAGISELIADLVESDVSPSCRPSLRPPRHWADRARRSAGRGELSLQAACHLTSCVARLRSAAHHRAASHRCRPDASAGPYRHRPRRRTTARAGSGSPVARQPVRISRSAASARVPPSRPSEAAAIAKARSRNTCPRRLVRVLHPRYPVDGVLHQRRHRGVVFRA